MTWRLARTVRLSAYSMIELQYLFAVNCAELIEPPCYAMHDQ